MSTSYTPIPNFEIEEQASPSYPIARSLRLSIPWSTIITVLSLLLNLVLVVIWFKSEQVGGWCRGAVYSPVNVGLEYTPLKFHNFYVNNRSIFDMPPSPEVDTAWQALYDHAAIRLTKEEAAKLPNSTWPIHGESDGYLGALYVFHQLHCLDVIRQTLYSAHYNITFDDALIRYCISGLRQSLTCSADTSVVVWQWSDLDNQVLERTDVLHSCKNFTQIQDWTRSRFVNLDSLNLTSNPNH